MVVVLQWMSGASNPESIEIGRGESVEVGRATLGRLGAPEDHHMSVRHFAVACDDHECRIWDLGSTNGTFVNGARVSEAPLKDGDRIEAGCSAFLVKVPVDHLGGGQAMPAITARRFTRTNPLFEIVNQTPFPAATLRWTDVDGKPRLTIVVKATYHIGEEGEEPRPTTKQLPLFTTDIPGGDGLQSVRFETDLVPFKPLADVVLVGRAHAPGRKPVSQLLAGLRVGPLHAAVAVFGDRTWDAKRLEVPTVTHAAPFVSMDLTYDRAFGGFDDQAGMYCRENHAGVGFIGKKSFARIQGLRLPNLEDPHHLIQSWDSRPRPVGFGFYGRGWAPRLAYAGTYDEKYLKERYPLPPSDFSYRFFNGAHPDLQVEGYLRGDEEVELANLSTDAESLRFRLPGVIPHVSVARWAISPAEWFEGRAQTDGSAPEDMPVVDEPLHVVLDTVVFVPDHGVLYQVCRAACHLDDLDSLEVARVTISR